MHHVECNKHGTLEVRKGEGKNKGIRRDGGKTWRLVPGFKKPQMIISHQSFYISRILLRHSKASLNAEKKEEEGGLGGRMGGKSEARERQQRVGGGGSLDASAVAVILLLRGSAAGGCAEGRSVEKTEERRTGGKERKGAPGQHCNSCSCSSRSGGKRERRRHREESKGCRDCLRGSIFMYAVFLHKEKRFE